MRNITETKKDDSVRLYGKSLLDDGSFEDFQNTIKIFGVIIRESFLDKPDKIEVNFPIKGKEFFTSRHTASLRSEKPRYLIPLTNENADMYICITDGTGWCYTETLFWVEKVNNIFPEKVKIFGHKYKITKNICRATN